MSLEKFTAALIINHLAIEGIERMKTNTKGKTPQTASPASTLERIKAALETPFDYKPITVERAVELADKILAYDNDEQAHQFIELLNGICAAHLARDNRLADVESLVMFAAHQAYSRTIHFTACYGEFAQLDPNSPDDLRLLTRKFQEGK